MGLRDEIVALAESYAGCGVGGDRERYLDLVGRTEDPTLRASMANMSGCALVVRGLWRELGLVDYRLEQPYVIGNAVADVMNIGREAGALRKLPCLPMAGDVVIVGGGMDGGGFEHVYTVISADAEFGADGAAIVHSVDGGAKDALGRQLIRANVREWEQRGNVLWDIVTHAAGVSRRRVRYVIDALRLPFPHSEKDTGPIPGCC